MKHERRNTERQKGTSYQSSLIVTRFQRRQRAVTLPHRENKLTHPDTMEIIQNCLKSREDSTIEGCREWPFQSEFRFGLSD